MHTIATALLTVALILPLTTAQARHGDDMTIAYFLEWPTPNQVAQLDKTYDKVLGNDFAWKSFSNGNEMSAAMASGDVQISYSQGLIPFIVAVSKGLPITMVGIAVSYSDADNCVVHNNAALDRSSKKTIAASLKGKKIASPEGNVTHYKLLKTLDYFGLSDKDVKITPVSGGNDAAAAFLTGQVDIGCAFGGPLDKMKEKGQVIMTGEEQINAGILTFDVISATDDFLKQHPDLMVKFLQVTEDANKKFARGNRPWNKLAKASGMKVDGVKGYLGDGGSFAFPTAKQQLGKEWFGGGAQEFTKNAADFFVSAGVMSKALRSYDKVIDSSYLSKVK